MGFWSKLKEKVAKKDNLAKESTQPIIVETTEENSKDPRDDIWVNEAPIIEECEPPTPNIDQEPKIAICPAKPVEELEITLDEVTPSYDSIILDTAPTYQLGEETSNLVLEVDRNSYIILNY